MKSVFDRSFHYTPAVETDIRKTFARERKRLRDRLLAEAAEKERNAAAAALTVQPIKRRA